MNSRKSVPTVVGLLLLGPLSVGAQPTIRATPRTSNTPDGNMCLRLSAGPSRFSGSPEGQALIRMKAELEVAERAMRSDTSQHKQIIIVQGRLDSVGRMITGSGDRTVNRFIFEARPGVATTIGQRVDPSDPMDQMSVSAKLRELQPQVAELARAGGPPIVGTLNIRLNTLGYIGLTTSAGTFPTSIDPMQPFAYCDYPLVESVEPGSPADRAGLMAGDTLTAYNNRDLRQTNVNYPDLLIPGKSLSIRYRRDGKALTTTMLVAARDPEQFRMLPAIGACTDAEIIAGCRSERVVVRGGNMNSGSAAASGVGTVGAVSAARVPRGGVGTRPSTGGVMAAGIARTPILMIDGGGALRFAGALIRAIDEQTAQNMGTEAGLFVFELSENAPSYQAGLRPGDWVVSANGLEVRDINAFRKAFEAKVKESLMILQVTSKTAGGRTITVRW